MEIKKFKLKIPNELLKKVNPSLKKLNNKIIINPSSEIPRQWLTKIEDIKVEKFEKGYKITFEILGHEIVRFVPNQNNVSFQKGRIPRLRKEVEKHPILAELLINQYRNN